MNKNVMLLLTGILLLTLACEPNQLGESRDGTDTANPPEASALPFANDINVYLADWLDYYEDRLPSFELNNYRRVDNIPLDTTVVFNTSLDPDYMDLYGNYLIASPNERKILDLYSYHIKLEKNLRGYLVALQGADSEAAIIYPNRNRRERILFLGPGSELEDGYWLDNDRLVIVGNMRSDNSEMIRPVLFEVDLLANRLILYEYRDRLPADDVNYIEDVKFADVGF